MLNVLSVDCDCTLTVTLEVVQVRHLELDDFLVPRYRLEAVSVDIGTVSLDLCNESAGVTLDVDDVLGVCHVTTLAAVSGNCLLYTGLTK